MRIVSVRLSRAAAEPAVMRPSTTTRSGMASRCTTGGLTVGSAGRRADQRRWGVLSGPFVLRNRPRITGRDGGHAAGRPSRRAGVAGRAFVRARPMRDACLVWGAGARDLAALTRRAEHVLDGALDRGDAIGRVAC